MPLKVVTVDLPNFPFIVVGETSSESPRQRSVTVPPNEDAFVIGGRPLMRPPPIPPPPLAPTTATHSVEGMNKGAKPWISRSMISE